MGDDTHSDERGQAQARPTGIDAKSAKTTAESALDGGRALDVYVTSGPKAPR
jgi:hypothetical protein